MATQSIAVVDPISTGACVANDCASRGYAVIAVWTKDIGETMRSHVPQTCKDLKYKAEVNELATIAETVAAVREAAGETPLAACIVGGESGVTLADRLSEELGLKTNGTQIPQRRDKKVQQELVKAAGMRSVRQAGGTSWSDVKEFVETEPMPVVVKPVESAGSDGVKLCKTKEEAEEHFHLLMTAQQKVGSQGAAVLVQEFLRGKEYVIDHVSHNGVHKTTMVWVYDKRPVNGSAFVYYGMVPVPSDSPEAEVLIPYIRGVLDALQIKFGPTHGEAMMTDNGPCLVEMNCRAHGGDGAWMPLATALTGGYTQVDAGVDTFVKEEAFETLPDKPPSPFKAAGQEVMLVSMTEGKVKSTPGYEEIKAMPSFHSMETSIGVGSEIQRTVDLFTLVGDAILINADQEVLKKDLARIRELETQCALFELEDHAMNLVRPRGYSELEPTCSELAGEVPSSPVLTSRTRVFSTDRADVDIPDAAKLPQSEAKECVAVVDPFSTGACMSLEAASRGYAVMAIWSKDTSAEIQAHVPLTCKDLKYRAVIPEAATLKETAEAVRAAAGDLKLVACIVGGESGVTLADALSEELGLRSNGTSIPQRRDKKVQQELVKAAGLRSVRQAGGTSWEDVKAFVESEPMPVVVKPVESAGSDGVKLCYKVEEAEEHFKLLMRSQMKVGSQGAAVLVQEFLRGEEYVVDHASLNGVHKTTMVWKYDKRPVNGAPFCYYGMVPVAIDSPEAKQLIPYIRGVLDALKIQHGPTHGEAMMTPDGPCLVEMNCRAHGGDGAWIPLAKALTGGYTMVSAGVDAFVNEASFEKVPDVPPSPFKASGQIVMMVSMAEGKVMGLPGYEQIQKMKSFVSLETGIDIGSSISYTVDLFSMVGQAVLMHPDTEVVKKDVEAIRQMEVDCTMFALEEHAETLGRPRTGSENLRPHYSEIAAGGAPANQGSWCALM